MEDDSWLPGFSRGINALTKQAKLSASVGNAEVLRNGIERPIGDVDNGLSLKPGQYAEYKFEKTAHVSRARLVFDSDFNRETQPVGSIYKRPMYATYYLDTKATYVPKTMTRGFKISLALADGTSKGIEVKDNHQRLVYVDIDADVAAVRYEPVSTWGNAESHVFSFDLV
jgi:hypothetical protein